MVMTGVVVIMLMIVRVLMRRFRSADDWLLFCGFGSRFGGLLGLLFGDCQWITFRVLSMGNGKLLV